MRHRSIAITITALVISLTTIGLVIIIAADWVPFLLIAWAATAAIPIALAYFVELYRDAWARDFNAAALAGKLGKDYQEAAIARQHSASMPQELAEHIVSDVLDAQRRRSKYPM